MQSKSMTTTITQPPSTRILYLKPAEEKLSKKPRKTVIWTEDTVDNENLNRMKSNSLNNFFLFCLLNYIIILNYNSKIFFWAGNYGLNYILLLFLPRQFLEVV